MGVSEWPKKLWSSIVLVYSSLVGALILSILSLLASICCVGSFLWHPFDFWSRRALKFKSHVCNAHWTLICLVVEWWTGANFCFSGTNVPLYESALITCNHRFYIDFTLMMCVALRKGRLGVVKFIMKDFIKWIPGFGWGVYLCEHIFISRSWASDKGPMEAGFENLRQKNLPVWLMLFVEGTRLCPTKLAESQAFSKKNGYPVLKHVLLPRTKGFVATANALRDSICPVLYDVTLAYPQGRVSTNYIGSRQGGNACLHVRRWEMKDLPRDDEELKKWCINMWKEKDDLLEYFSKNGSFPEPHFDDPWARPPLLLPKVVKKA